jgi:geranylgeranyl diphosphate synthase type II
MRYSILGGGKRLRPLLTISAIKAVQGNEEDGLVAGCAVEFVHAYSLVHDDLPVMDNDDIRRGKPSCHRKFGEALAILAGDALLTHAFFVLEQGVPRECLCTAVRTLAFASGARGMVGGQADDIRSYESQHVTQEYVESIHSRKTACLIEAALFIGGMVARANQENLAALGIYGRALGLAFQITDDFLAYTGKTEALKRPTGSDEKHLRCTYPRVVGSRASQKRACDLIDQALLAIRAFGSNAHPLAALAEFVKCRVTICD